MEPNFPVHCWSQMFTFYISWAFGYAVTGRKWSGL